MDLANMGGYGGNLEAVLGSAVFTNRKHVDTHVPVHLSKILNGNSPGAG
jgi:hypothetical protein